MRQKEEGDMTKWQATVPWLAILSLVVGGLFACGDDDSDFRTPTYRAVTVQNTEPRLDSDGDIIDAHDGCLQFFDGRYYLYGTAYGRSAGFGVNNRFRVYSSPDLEHWDFDGELLRDQPSGVFYRPYVAYNPNTDQYVAWFNWYPELWDGQTGVAVSDTPVGPFAIVDLDVQLAWASAIPGDGSLFVDDDGTGYFIYTVIGGLHAIVIDRLTPDFLGSTGEHSAFLGMISEAAAMFRRGDLYYAVFGLTCCFCPEGSGARVHSAATPLGPYTPASNINRDASFRIIVPAQQTFVARIPVPDGDAFVWMGDLWGTRPDGIKGHDFQYWSAPLQFAADGTILPMERLSSWSAVVRIGEDRPRVENPYRLPRYTDPNPVTTDPCTGQPIPPEEWDTE